MKKIISSSPKKQSESKAPLDLRKAIATTSKVEALWKDLTPIARRDFIRWVDSAKQLETRERRIKRIPDMLISGKRRPCCYAVVPMDLYKTLATLPKAKAQWKDLTPDERRDFVAWIDSAKNKDESMHRVEKVCVMLLGGKRHP